MACHILQKHLGDLAQVVLPMEIIERLYKQNFFSKLSYNELKKSDGILTEGPLDELHSTILKDHNQLKEFACELMGFEESEQMAIAIVKEYSKNLESSITIINVAILCTLDLQL